MHLVQIPDKREYQQEGIKFLTEKGRAYLADDFGLGKTLSVLSAVANRKALPMLIVGPKLALYTWKNELEKWFDVPSAVYTEKPHEREKAWREFIDYEYPALITNYAFLEEIWERKFPLWGSFVCDEIEKGGLLNRKSQTFHRVLPFARSISTIYLTTATPMRKTPADLFAPLNIIDPEKFSSYWRFIYTHCVVTKGDFGLIIERRPASPLELKKMLSEYMLRRVDKLSLPPFLRQVYPIPMTDSQSLLYRAMEKDMLVDLKGYFGGVAEGFKDVAVAQNVIVKIMQLRKILVTPRLLGLDMNGAFLDSLPDILESAFEEGTPVVIFTPFRKALPYIQQRILDTMPGVDITLLHGGLPAREIDARKSGFQGSKNPRRVCICVIKSGASFELYMSSTCFFIGYEWDCGENKQCEGRLYRPGQKRPVHAYYVLHPNTVDEVLKATLNDKQRGIDWTITVQDVAENIKNRNSND